MGGEVFSDWSREREGAAASVLVVRTRMKRRGRSMGGVYGGMTNGASQKFEDWLCAAGAHNPHGVEAVGLGGAMCFCSHMRHASGHRGCGQKHGTRRWWRL